MIPFWCSGGEVLVAGIRGGVHAYGLTCDEGGGGAEDVGECIAAHEATPERNIEL